MKKTYLNILWALLTLFVVSACTEEDYGDADKNGLVSASALSFSVAQTENQNEYTYTNTSTSIAKDVRMFWDFGDGKAVESQVGDVVTKVYKKAGSYTVSLLAFTKDGHTATSQTLVVDKDLKDDSFTWKGFGYNSDANLVKNATWTASTWVADDSWSTVTQPKVTMDGTNSVELVYSDASGSSNWQSQLHLESNITVSSAKTYDYSVCITSSVDLPAVTVKTGMVGDDNTFFFQDDNAYSVKAGVPFVVAKTDLAGFDGDVKFTFDFAPTPAGAEIVISDLYLAEHSDANVAPLDYSSDANLWKAIDANKSYSVGHWWSDANWSQIGNPDFSADGSVYTIVAKDATAAEWQAQNTITPNSLPLSGSAAYDFSCIMKANVDTRVTVKMCQSDDDDNSLFYTNAINLKAGEVQAVAFLDQALAKGADAANCKLIFDLGGCAKGTEFTVGNITLIQK